MFIFWCLFITVTAQSQVVIQVNAGSRAPYGTYQSLFIDRKGHCSFSLNEMSGKVLDSSFFNIPVSQVDSLLNNAERLGFFNLNERYNGDRADGAGIFISLDRSGRRHSVDLLNKDLAPVHTLVDQLNAVLAPHRIRINYGQ